MKKSIKKKAFLTMSVALLFLVSVGTTLAYILANTDSVANTFTPAKVSCAVVENGVEDENTNHIVYNDTTKTDVKIKNTGDTDAYIRVAVVVNWAKEDGTKVWAQKPVLGTDYIIDLALENGWLEGKDGFYYYTEAVAPVTECSHAVNGSCDRCCTGVLIKNCSQEADANIPEGYYLSVEIVASAIQSKPDRVVEDEWTNAMVTVGSEDGTLTITNTGD